MRHFAKRGAAMMAACLLVVLALGVAVLSGHAACAWADDTQNATSENTAASDAAGTTATAGGAQAASNSATATNEANASANTENAASSEASEDSDRQEIDLDFEANYIKENQLPDSSFIYDTSIADLAKADTYYDQQTVQVVGEVVGDIINEGVDGDYCWVVLWDDGDTVTLYMKRVDAEVIDTLGSYSRKGTTLQVRGVFNLVCSDHDGSSDLHVTNVAVIAKGSHVKQEAQIVDFIPGILLLFAGVMLLILYRRLQERQR